MAKGVGQAPGAGMPAPLPERYRLVTTWETPRPTKGLWLFNPEGIDLDDHGMVAITERGNHRIIVLHANQTPNRQLDPPKYFGQLGSRPGEFNSPEDIAFSADSQRLYVADTGNRRVQVLDRKGTVQGIWTGVGLPRGIAALDDGRVLVSDAEGSIIRVFAPNGTPQGAWGAPGRAAGELMTPLGLAEGADGLIYVADHGNQRVQWLGQDGKPAGELRLDNTKGPGGAPLDVALGENNQLFVAVDRGVLRFVNRSVYGGLMAPLKEFVPAGCTDCRSCRTYVPEVLVHEGVRRLAANPRAGLIFIYSPSLRWMDRMEYYPSKGQPPSSWPSNCLELGRDPELFHNTDGVRLDYFVQPGHEDCAKGCVRVLDSGGVSRTYRTTDGSLLDFNPNFPVPRNPGQDVSGPSVVLTGNLASGPVLSPARMIRRTRTNECLRAVAPPGFEEGLCIPDNHWWLRAVEGAAVLNTGYQQLHVGSASAPIFGLVLNPPRSGFRAFSDLTYDVQGNLWLLARDGHVLQVDGRGRPQAEIELQGLAPRTAEAIDVDRPAAGRRAHRAHRGRLAVPLHQDRRAACRLAHRRPGRPGPLSGRDRRAGSRRRRGGSTPRFPEPGCALLPECPPAERQRFSTGLSNVAASRCAATTGCCAWRGHSPTSTVPRDRMPATWVVPSSCVGRRHEAADSGVGDSCSRSRGRSRPRAGSRRRGREVRPRALVGDRRTRGCRRWSADRRGGGGGRGRAARRLRAAGRSRPGRRRVVLGCRRSMASSHPAGRHRVAPPAGSAVRGATRDPRRPGVAGRAR